MTELSRFHFEIVFEKSSIICDYLADSFFKLWVISVIYCTVY